MGSVPRPNSIMDCHAFFGQRALSKLSTHAKVELFHPSGGRRPIGPQCHMEISLRPTVCGMLRYWGDMVNNDRCWSLPSRCSYDARFQRFNSNATKCKYACSRAESVVRRGGPCAVVAANYHVINWQFGGRDAASPSNCDVVAIPIMKVWALARPGQATKNWVNSKLGNLHGPVAVR